MNGLWALVRWGVKSTVALGANVALLTVWVDGLGVPPELAVLINNPECNKVFLGAFQAHFLHYFAVNNLLFQGLIPEIRAFLSGQRANTYIIAPFRDVNRSIFAIINFANVVS